MLVTGDYRGALGDAGDFLSENARFIGYIKDDELVNLAAFDNYDGVNIDIHVFSSGRMFLPWLRACGRYAFDLCGCERMTSKNCADDFQMEKMLPRAGFKLEGTIRKALPNGSDMIVYGALKDEFRFR